MTTHRELVLDDFVPVELPENINYLSAKVGDFEITLEPHLVTGFCIGIYCPAKQRLALEKRAVWLLNHPAGTIPQGVSKRTAETALRYANQLLIKYNPHYDLQ